MRAFAELYDIAAARHGGAAEIEKRIPAPKSPAELREIPDDRYLAGIARAVFQAGFNWKVIENKWEGFEAAFEGFSPNRCAMMPDDDIDRLLQDRRIVRHGKKIQSVRDNAVLLVELARDHGSAANFFADHPPQDYVGLLTILKKRGSRLGGTTAQYFLRRMGVDSVIFTRDVVAALIRECIVDKAPSSQRDLGKCQAAFNRWMEEDGATLTRISRVLALSIDG